MAATTAGAFKALIEGGGLGLAVYRDQAPPNAPLPFVVVVEGIGRATQPGDFGSATSAVLVTEEVQVDLWQAKKDPATGTRTEDYTLLPSLVRLLRGARLPDPPTRSWPLVVRDAKRVPAQEPRPGDPGSNLVRDTISVVFDREV
jgi:hypothetical protein